MRYRYFEISDFKGIRNVRLDFSAAPSSNIFTLVGLNESGKTTILEAISLFKYGEQDFEQLFEQADRDLERLIPVSQRANFNGDIKICAGIKLDITDVAALTKHMSQAGVRSFQTSTEFTIKEVYRFKNSRYQSKDRFWDIALSGRLPGEPRRRTLLSADKTWHRAVQFIATRMVPIRYFPNFLFEFPDRIYLEPDETSVKERFYRDVLEGVLQALDLNANVNDHILARARSEDRKDKDSLESLLLQMGRNVTERVFGAWSEIFGRRVKGKTVVLDLGAEDSERLYIRFRIQDSDGYFAVSERSLGFRWFFVYLLLTSYTTGASSTPVLFMFDEPASNLHSSAQAELLRSFSRLAQDNSIIYTTHSHHMINPDWLESTYVVRNAGIYDDEFEEFNAGRTDIRLDRFRTFAAAHPDQSNYFQPILDVLDYKPSRLENVPLVILVEGKNDFYSLRFAQFLFDVHKPEYFLPGTGAGTLDQVIRLYVGWGREFIVLLDSDKEGTVQRTRYEKTFGPLVAGRVVELGDVNEDWRGQELEELFDSADRIAIQQLVEPGSADYVKKKFNRAVQEATLRKLKVDVTPDTSRRFKELLAFLQTSLEGTQP